MEIREEFIIERNGRRFVLVAGLLDLAHRKGLQSIDQEVLQFPSEENGHTTICRSTVTDRDGRRFQGIGDANGGNVGRAIAPHAIRMAATRSLARALRDFCNIGATVLEELGPEDARDEQGEYPRTARQSPQNAASRPQNGSGERKATEKQVAFLKRLIEQSGHSMERFEEKYGPINEITAGVASYNIERLQRVGEGTDG